MERIGRPSPPESWAATPCVAQARGDVAMPDVVVTSRARLGLIIPSMNRLTETHFHHYAPEGVEIHVTRVRITRGGTLDLIPLAEQLPAIVDGARLLAEASCDVIVYHCTGSSMEAGPEAERQTWCSSRRTTARSTTRRS